ncbi:Very-long-chain 3-oxoacyl-CoA [Cyphellophora attinorum]|uniref:Very-long-chain 3-oxoacyl-CoA n=1 Tax=Cyphellophora attinorum TaxID=1664694 RepID=A0A0N1HIV2_9EURO|nr:Very-long-chain 3-oxoacyl-CoA [Phialophora attinorum]KPI36143.1 Very-long-chain 3-oxoacyl-CoA [Phialophora attinorum]
MPIPIIHWFYASNLPKYLQPSSSGKTSWALITGASDGIGLALSDQLATAGFNVLLHGRNEAKLTRIQSELARAHPKREFRTIAVDASAFTTADINRIAAAVAELPLTVLINNVGGTAPLSSNFKHFECMTPTEIQALYSLNVQFPLQLTCALLPQLTANKQQPTLILTCGSGSQIGQPFIAAYSGCKAALHAWNRALHAEQATAGSAVEVLEVVVGPTYTQQLQKEASIKPGLTMPTAEVMARAILARVGHGHRSVTPYFWHALQGALLYGLLPAGVVDWVVARVLLPSVEVKKE